MRAIVAGEPDLCRCGHRIDHHGGPFGCASQMRPNWLCPCRRTYAEALASVPRGPTAQEARVYAIQSVAELGRGIDIAMTQLDAGYDSEALETLLLAKAAAHVAEAAIQRIRP